MKKLLTFIVVLMLCLCISACAPATTSKTPDTQTQATNSRFRTGEVKEYKGKLLSPAIGPRDNSILGVQHIDIKQYSLKIVGNRS